jgi:hypothetical protein
MTTMLIGGLLVMMQSPNRPTHSCCAFTKSLIPIMLLSSAAATMCYLFINITYLAECDPPLYGPPHGGSIAGKSCPGSGTRCVHGSASVGECSWESQ